jgi:integrase
VTHSKADALTEREFESLLQGARKLDSPTDTEAVAAVLLTGRLGLRSGELGHLTGEWVDWQRSVIDIPRHDPCTKSDQGDPCGDCRQKAKQVVDYHDKDISLDAVLADAWMPKTEAAARSVPFGFSVRTEMALEDLIAHGDGWPLSVQGVYRRVKAAAAEAPDVDTDKVRPHGLRATAASYHAAQGLETLALQSLFGWSQLSTAEKYITSSDEQTRRAVEAVHSR